MCKTFSVVSKLKLFAAVFFFFPILVFSQTGSWIEQVLQPSMSGQWLADRGDNCLGYTKANSQYIYFFDTNVSQWTEVDLGSPQTFRDVEASGQTIMAYSDAMIIGYSAATSQWDTLYYQGTLLNDTGPGELRSYGCGEKLAYFVTYQYFYVFDSDLGLWQSYSYLYPGAAVGGNFWSGDNYAGAIIDQNPPNYPLNLVYSLPMHAFNENQQGGWYYHTDWGMTHGFVAYWSDAVNTVIVTGYSSQSNQFLSRTFPSSTSGAGDCLFPESFVEKTVAVYHNMVSPGTARLFAYDTRQGQWYEANYYSQNFSSASGWRYGGRVARALEVNPQTNEVTYLVFNGAGGGFNTLTPGIHSGLGGWVSNPFGSGIMASDTTIVWFFNPATQNSHYANMAGSSSTGFYLGDNFAMQGSYPIQGSPAKMVIFNADTDHLTTINTGITSGINVEGSPYLCAFTAGATHEEVYFYSGITDAHQTVVFPASSYPSLTVGNRLAVASAYTEAVLYDGAADMLFPLAYHPSSMMLEDDIAIFQKSNQAIDAYSRYSQQISEFTIPEQINFLQARGALGLIASPGFSKYYAYSGFYNNLVPLQPAGQWQSSLVGESAALVIRVDRIYAFDPQAPTAIEPTVPAPGTFQLSQNYPNPFNPVTQIRFDLPKSGEVQLIVYDILGRKVSTLVDKKMPAGRYDVQWNGTNHAGQAMASGVYLYRMKAGKYSVVRKMLLVR